jgi:ATP-binding cassette subfamily B (MDR/TAP) protein 1
MSGEIRINDRNINSLDLKWWRTQIGLVQQEPFMFNDTVYNNVAFGLIGSQWEDASEEVKRGLVEKACKEAFVDEFVQRLPSVYIPSTSLYHAHTDHNRDTPRSSGKMA